MRITGTFRADRMVSFLGAMSTLLALWLATALPARAHEVLPTIADMEQIGDELHFDLRVSIESFIAGIDLSATEDTNDTPQAAHYDLLRAQEPDALAAEFADFWPQMQARFFVIIDDTPVTIINPDITVGPVGNVELVRESELSFVAPIPEGAQSVQVGWDAGFGTLVLRQQGVEAPYDGFLQAGTMSDPIKLSGGSAAGGWRTFFNYIPVGFDHIVPKGLDHILFVLGLFFLSTRFSPLLLQVSLFTAAHTITLALAALGFVSIPGSIVEPLIAASIVYVAVENILTKNLSPWRPAIVFLFGLLHGLGFASVLSEFGLPDSAFIPALIGFNIGVEIGQLAVIAVMFLAVWQAIRIDQGENEVAQGRVIYGVLILAAVVLIVLNPTALSAALEAPSSLFLGPMLAIFALCVAAITFRDQLEAYRRIAAIPASVFIGLVGAYWFVERVFL